MCSFVFPFHKENSGKCCPNLQIKFCASAVNLICVFCDLCVVVSSIFKFKLPFMRMARPVVHARKAKLQEMLPKFAKRVFGKCCRSHLRVLCFVCHIYIWTAIHAHGSVRCSFSQGKHGKCCPNLQNEFLASAECNMQHSECCMHLAPQTGSSECCRFHLCVLRCFVKLSCLPE